MNIRGILSKSFCWGVLVASFTWFVTIFLYFHLSQENYSFKAALNRDFLKNYTIPQIQIPLARKHRLHPYNTTDYHQQGGWMNPRKSKSAFIHSLSQHNFGVIQNDGDKYVRDIGYKQHAFNALVSNNIGVFRDVPDTRHKVCSLQQYDTDLPTATIIMCFYNEHMMTLLRSVKTVLERTPPQYLQEIILVNDHSSFDELVEDLPAKLRELDDSGKIRLLRNEERQGLIRSRVIGARNATGEVLIFLDSHIEVNTMWAEPLLHRIKHEPSTIAVPVIDIVNADTFEYTPSPLVRGGFNWALHFKWENLPEGTIKDEASFAGPFNSPTMAGGLFAVERKYFHDIGEYDMGMDIWGGENLEISFRVWQCGGAIKILPCSRVGHVFRKKRPYGSPDGQDTMLTNSLRLANVWMDEFKEYFFKQAKIHIGHTYGDVSDRIELRNKLKCKNFAWYLKHVYPELSLPSEVEKKNATKTAGVFQPWHSRKRSYTANFMLRLAQTDLCASVTTPKVKGFWQRGSQLILTPCVRTPNQVWYETERAELVLDKLLCMEATLETNYAFPVLGKCHEMLGDQQWRFTNSENTPIYNMATGTCLRATSATSGAGIVLDLCTKESQNMWDVIN